MRDAKRPKLPRYSQKRGWQGGDARTLYTFTDKHSGRIHVVPVHWAEGMGAELLVRVATRLEAEAAGFPAGWIVEG